MSIFNNKLKLSLGAALMAYAAASTPVAQAQAHKFVSLGTGGVTGVYYAAGGAWFAPDGSLCFRVVACQPWRDASGYDQRLAL